MSFEAAQMSPSGCSRNRTHFSKKYCLHVRVKCPQKVGSENRTIVFAIELMKTTYYLLMMYAIAPIHIHYLKRKCNVHNSYIVGILMHFLFHMADHCNFLTMMVKTTKLSCCGYIPYKQYTQLLIHTGNLFHRARTIFSLSYAAQSHTPNIHTPPPISLCLCYSFTILL